MLTTAPNRNDDGSLITNETHEDATNNNIDVDDHVIVLDEMRKELGKTWRIFQKIFEFIFLPIIYTSLFITAWFTISNAYHVFSWIAIITSISYILCVVHTLLFSTHLHFHTIDYKPVPGMSHNYIPYKLNKHVNKPWDSVSHMSHIRGSSIYKWHSTLMSYGSFAGLSAAICKLFQIYGGDYGHESSEMHYSNYQIAGVWCLLFGGLGGLILVNFEVYASPTFSKGYNVGCEIIHVFGAFCYAIIGNLAFAMFNEFNAISVCLMIGALSLLAAYRLNRLYQYRKNLNKDQDKEQYEKWVHNMSRINIGVEVCGITFSVIGVCVMIYQLGES